MWRRLPGLGPTVLLHAALAALAVLAAGVRPAAANPSDAPQCRDPYPGGPRTDNPLMTVPAPPASDPLRGARLFVDGPAHGLAAGAIARFLGIDTAVPTGRPLPAFSEHESWPAFAAEVAQRLPSLPAGVRYRIKLLEKIAAEPEAQRISRFSEGGTPTGIYSQTQKVLCHILLADPRSVPIITTYFLHPTLGGCPTDAQDAAYRPLFTQQVDALARAIGNRPVILLLELDYVGSSGCIARTGQLAGWESLMRYEASALEALPHTAVYIEGGYADANTAAYAARVLGASGVRGVQGFWLNDTHNDWTSHEITYGRAISRRIGGLPFIVNTATNGRGPLLNPHPRTQGIEDLCNAPGRGLGPRPTTDTGLPGVSAYLWTFPPGNSSGSCHGGPPSGTWWEARALGLAARANAQLGPGFPSRPY
jgi:endoglucanase